MTQKTGNSKIGSSLLIAGGVFQALFAVMHIGMFWGIAKDPTLSAQIRPLLQIFNAAVLVTVLFFTYLSFFRRRELIETSLGRATCLFIGLFYVQRGLVDAVVNGVHLLVLVLMGLVAALYLVARFMPQPGRGSVTDVALGGAASN